MGKSAGKSAHKDAVKAINLRYTSALCDTATAFLDVQAPNQSLEERLQVFRNIGYVMMSCDATVSMLSAPK